MSSINEKMTALADAVREKAELTAPLTIDEMTTAISELYTEGVDTSDATVTAGDILEGKTAYGADGEKLTGTIQSIEAQNYRPGTENIVIPANSYLKGAQTILGSINLAPSNIRSGVTLFNVKGTFTSDATATAADIAPGKFAYADGVKLYGNMPDATITEEGNVVTITQGYNRKESKTTVGYATALEPFTPRNTDYTIIAKTYLTEEFVIKGDANLSGGNIKEGVTIFGVKGTFSGVDTRDANALAADILSGKTAYVKGEKVTGAMPYATATVNGNVVTLSAGYQTGDTVTIPEAPEPTVNGNVVTLSAGYQTGSTVTVGTLFPSAPIVPGTADITIPQGSFLSSDLVVQGSAALTPENIRAGEVVFNIRGSFTDDATAGSFDILAGKTAYVKGEKVTGTILSITEETAYTPGTEDVTIPKGVYLSAPQVIKGDANLLPENIKQGVTIFNVEGTAQGGVDTTDATATSGDILSGKTAYVKDEKLTGTIPVIDESRTYTPGTADLTIPGGFYVSVPQTVKGDTNLSAENIKTGVKIFNVTGTFTSDATANASKIEQGATAYVNGEKVTGTATIKVGYDIWENVEGFICQRLPTTTKTPTPTWGVGRIQYNNGELYSPQDNIKARDPIQGITFFASGRWPNETSGYCIANGKVYRVWIENIQVDGKWIYDILHRQIPDLNGVTELVIVNGDRCICRSGGQFYGVKQEGIVYPIEGIEGGSLFNYTDTTGYATVVSNGDIVRIRFSDDEPYVERDPLDKGVDFVNVNYLGEYDVYLDYGGAAYMLATKNSKGMGTLWYRDAVNRGSGWVETNLTHLDQRNWLGKCITQREEHYWWDEETGEDHWDFINRQTEVALHIDTDGRLWKIAAKCDDNGNPAGIEYTQVGEDSDWNCVPPSITPGRTVDSRTLAQKGGKLVVLITDREPDIGITWEEFWFSPPGKLIAISDGNRLCFAHEDKFFFLGSPGGLI